MFSDTAGMIEADIAAASMVDLVFSSESEQ